MTGGRVVEPGLFMARRAMLLGLVGMLLPSRAFAQKPSTPPRVGWLSAGSEPDPFLEAFREGLRALDYVEGQNIVLETRHAHGDLEALRRGASELMQAKVVLIVASLTAVRAARAIKDIPVIFTISGDPVEAGLVQSLSRPGGNLTGSTFLSLELAGKRVELLKEALPRLHSLAALSNTDHPERRRSCAPPKGPLRSSGSISSTLPSRSLPSDRARSSIRHSKVCDGRARTR